MADRFDGAVAVVTGGGAHTERALGIGEATCKQFAREGATVVVTDVEAAMAERTVAAIEDENESSGRAVAREMDVTDEESVEDVLEWCESEFGSLDALVNSAGIRVPAEPVAEADVETFDDIYRVNLRGMAVTAKHAVPLLAREDGGAIVNVASANATFGRENWSQYDATKAGVLGLTRDMACDHASDGIRANAVSPGWTTTDYHLREYEGDPEEFVEEQTSRRSDGPAILQRNAHPREQASAICWLASEEASYITGADIPVDGGLTAAGHIAFD